MSRFKRARMAAGTFGVAMAIGFVMQSGDSTARVAPMPDLVSSDALNLSEITLISAVAPDLDMPGTETAILSQPKVPTIELMRAPESPATPALLQQGGNCAPSVTVLALHTAEVQLDIGAPCLPNSRATIEHHGLKLTYALNDQGIGSVVLPALDRDAEYITIFDTDETVVTSVDVPAAGGLVQTVVQWQGQSALQLHALAEGASYFDAGHAWSGEDTADGPAVVRKYGQGDTPLDYRAEVFSAPRDVATAMNLTLEAEITEHSCDRTVDAQMMHFSDAATGRVRDIALSMPACDGTGGYLVLKNLSQDRRVAQN